MKKLIAVAVASMFASAAYAQVANTPGQPPTQPAAGTGGKLTKQPATDMPVTSSTTTTDSSMAKPTTGAERKAARKAKRAAKVGDKPIN